MSSNSYFKKFLKGTEGPVADAGSTDQAFQGAEENLLQSSEAVVGAVNALKGLADGSVSPIEAALDIKTAIDVVQGLSRQLSESLIMPLMTHLAAFKGEAFLPVAKQLDPVMGIDVHFVTVPPGTPVPLPHPYISVLFRTKDWVSCMVNMVKAEVMSAVQEAQPNANEPQTEAEEAAQAKTDKLINQADGLVSTALGMAGLSATVLIGGVLPRAITGTTSRVIPHIPMGAGFHPSFDVPIAKNNGTVYLGSLFVTADGDPMAGMMHLNYDCWDIGIVDLFKSQRNSTKKSPDPKNPKTELFVPSGSILPIPWSRPVLVNTIPTPISPLSIGDRLFKSGLGKLKKSKAIAELRKKFKQKEKRDRGFCAKKEPMTTQQLANLYEREIRTGGRASVNEVANDGYRLGVEHIRENSRSIEDAVFSKENIRRVEDHLSLNPYLMNDDGEMYANNKVMIDRLKAIERGEIIATDTDKAFLTHELRENELMKEGLNYEQAHAQTCKGMVLILKQKKVLLVVFTQKKLKKL
jgi:rhs family protein (fragment)